MNFACKLLVNCSVFALVISFNDNLSNDAAIINQDAENEGWIFKIKISNQDQYNSLMSLEQYLEFLEK